GAAAELARGLEHAVEPADRPHGLGAAQPHREAPAGHRPASSARASSSRLAAIGPPSAPSTPRPVAPPTLTTLAAPAMSTAGAPTAMHRAGVSGAPRSTIAAWGIAPAAAACA